ncbi:uncharacterized protein TORIP [Drosophila virilis]|uniref:Uncharacterized protein n=1 Tax=Drosophila virilis TaxID=7244 RepID=B4LBN3_DROVI|nr:uncharacterized protein LOC6623074 [Drosophila virilis]EDW70843.1 uncharacterized protein Dvir_GJ14006 [Drosophila virilis]
MTSRASIHAHRNLSGSGSPTANLLSQSDIQGTRSVYYREEENNSSDDENEVLESDETPDQEELPTTDTDEDDSLQPRRPLSATTPNRSVTAPPRAESQLPLAKSANVQPSKSQFKLIPYAIIIILPLFACSRLLKSEPQVKRCAFEELRQRPPLQSEDVWKALSINIELLLNKKIKSPNVYLFLHSNQSSEYPIQKLINDIARETSKCFDGQRPIEMSLKDFETQNGDDYGYPIEQYKKKLREGNVFLIVNLNDIPPNSARALHTICDTYSPIAPDVVIFMTLRTHLANTVGSPAQMAYKTLQELWKQVPDNELDALITRVIDQVLLLQS